MMISVLRYFILIISLLIYPATSYGQSRLSERLSESAFGKALELLQQQKYEAAQQYMEAYIVQHQDSQYAIEAAYYAALCAVKLDRADGEVRLQEFVEKHPYHQKAPLAYYELGNLYGSRQDYAPCITYYLAVDTAQLDDDLRAELQYKLGYAYLNEKDFEQALLYFDHIKNDTTPYTSASNYYAGYLALKKGNYETALADLQKAGENEAYQAVVPYLILEVFYQAKRFQDLTTYATKIQTKQADLKNQEDVALLTAEAYFFLEDYVAAVQHYENYLYLQPAEVSHEVRYRLAYALYKIGETYKALRYLKELALQNTHLAQLASYYMGLIYLKTDQKNLALAAFDQASQLNFVNDIQIEAAFQYAQLSYELGNLKIALEALQKFKKTYPASQHMPTVDNLLSQLYFHTHHYELTIAHIEGLAEKSESILQIYQKATFYKGNTCFNQEAYDKAIVWLQKSLRYPRDIEITLQTHLWLAESYAAQQVYDQAITHYQAVLAAEAKKNTPYYQDALYGIGYAYFNTGSYQQALPFFLQYINLPTSNTRIATWRSDALVRTADCYYVTKQYTQALALYDKTQADYPVHNHYQKALIYEILGNFKEAQQNLATIINTYEHTSYYEKALFEYANLALKHQDYPLAVKSFTNFLQKKPYSSLVPDALLNRAISQVNLKQYAEAGKDYERLLKDYSTHINAQSALLALPQLVIQEGNPEKLQQYLANYKAANPSSHILDSISFEAAKSLFYSQNYSQAIEQFNEFIVNYPTSALLNEATFLVAEAYYRLGDEAQALIQYHKACNNKQTPFYNKICLRIASIAYKQKDFKTALANYTELREQASNRKETYYALEGIMKTSDALQEYDQVNQAASLIIKQGNITVNAVNQAALYLGKAAMQQSKKEEALHYFKQIVESEQDTYAAEAQYLIAYVYYQLGEHTQSLETLFTLNKQFADYPIWIDQGFLLMVENYIALHEIFQARATLQSIIDHATDTTIIHTAQEKLQNLIQQAAQDSLAQAAQTQPSPEESEFKTLEEDKNTNL